MHDSGRIETSPLVNRVVVGVPSERIRSNHFSANDYSQLSPVCKNLDPEPSYSARGGLTIHICSIRTDTGERRRDRECGCNFRMTRFVRSLLFRVRPLDRSILLESSGCAA